MIQIKKCSHFAILPTSVLNRFLFFLSLKITGFANTNLMPLSFMTEKKNRYHSSEIRGFYWIKLFFKKQDTLHLPNFWNMKIKTHVLTLISEKKLLCKKINPIVVTICSSSMKKGNDYLGILIPNKYFSSR